MIICLDLKALRQLVSSSGTMGSGSGAAHEREVKAIAVSKDVGVLVSASADSTLRVWNLDNDKLQWTLAGHRNEVSTNYKTYRSTVHYLRLKFSLATPIRQHSKPGLR